MADRRGAGVLVAACRFVGGGLRLVALASDFSAKAFESWRDEELFFSVGATGEQME